MHRLKAGMLIAGLSLGFTLMQCSKKISPDQPDLFPDFAIVSTSPANGSTNVSDSITISISFNERVDTRFVGLMMAPLPPEFYSRLTWSADGKTLSSPVKLLPNTVYSLVVYYAQDRFADALDQPYSINFTTGASLPNARISGKTVAPFNDPFQGFVGLAKINLQSIFNSDPPNDQALQQNLVAVTSIRNVAGAFQFLHVPAGTYWPFAVREVNLDGKFSLGGGDQIQAYDGNNDGLPDSVTVSAGQQIAAIEIGLPLVGIKIVHTLPADGATNVPLATHLEVTFSLPIDTAASFGLFAAPIPEGLRTSDLVFSADGKTLKTRTRVNLQSNTTYTVLLYGTKSRSGQVLASPVQISFTTGSAFPTGEIRGTATLRGTAGSTQNALVGLLKTDLPTVITQIIQGGDPTEVLRGALVGISYVRDAAGNFVISHVPAGTYWPAGAKDEDNDGRIEPTPSAGRPAEPIGFYDADHDGIATRADSLNLAPGEKKTGVPMVFQRLF